MDKETSPSIVLKDPHQDSKDKQTEGSKEKSKDQKGHSNRRTKEDEILHKLSKLASQVAASDEFMQKLSALPEMFAKQAERIDALSAPREESYWDYDPRDQYEFGEDYYDGNEYADQNPFQTPKDMFASLLSPQLPETGTTDTIINASNAWVTISYNDEICLLIETTSTTPHTGDVQQNNPDEFSTLDMILKNAPPNAFGAPLEEGVAQRFRTLLDQAHDKKVWDKLKEDHKIPENCRVMGPPRVNKELWGNFDKNTITADCEIKGYQEMVGVTLISLAKVIQFINTNSGLMKGKTANDLMDLVTESTSAAAYLFQEMNLKRRSIVKKSLPQDVSILITSDIKTTDLLFGDNFAELLKAAKAALNITRPQRGRGGYRMQPYSFRGGKNKPGSAPHHFNAGNDNNLNYQRPPRFNRGARGGRGRGYHHNNFNKFSHPSQQSQNQL